ncbi:MAG: MbcA/ParS/Xre antitoxin family protein [Bacteroidota bacterium]
MEFQSSQIVKKKSKKASPSLANSLIILDSGVKPESKMTPIEKMNISKSGVTKKDLVSLKEKSSLDYDKLAKTLSVTRATLINKKPAEKFNASLSERIIGLAEIYSYGFEVFEGKAQFNSWINSPNNALGGKSPFDLLDSQFGREEVMSIIGRIDYGVYS